MRWLFVAALLAHAAWAQPLRVLLDPNATKVKFTVTDVIHTVHGTFRLTKGEIWIEAGTGKAGGQMIVSTASGDSGSHARDSRMNDKVLEASAYPEITFTPDRVEGTVTDKGDSAFTLHGHFGIHGAAHELTMQVKSHIEGGRVNATADFEVPYVKWGMKDPSTLFLRVKNSVLINIVAVGRTE